MTKTKQKIRTETIQRRIFFILVVCILLNVAFYTHFLNQTVINVVEREKKESEITGLFSEIGTLEFQYIQSKNDLSLEYAKELGFVESPTILFVSRTKDASLSFND